MRRENQTPSMTYSLSNKCTKNYCNWTCLVKVTVENVVACLFLRHSVYWVYVVAGTKLQVKTDSKKAAQKPSAQHSVKNSLKTSDCESVKKKLKSDAMSSLSVDTSKVCLSVCLLLCFTVVWLMSFLDVNSLWHKGSYSATSNNVKLVQWPLMGGLLHVVQQWGAFLAVPNVTVHPSTASVPITVLLYTGPLLYGFDLPLKG